MQAKIEIANSKKNNCLSRLFLEGSDGNCERLNLNDESRAEAEELTYKQLLGIDLGKQI